ncbi:MAG: KH domain-containing protein [Thermoanaerobaculia bacterium]
MAVEEVLLDVVRLLVDDPRAVSVRRVEGDGEWLLELDVAPDDRGKVIGRRGRTIESLRSLAAARAPENGRSYEVELLDD